MVSVETQTESDGWRSTPLVSPEHSEDELSDAMDKSGDVSWNPDEDMLSESSEEEEEAQLESQCTNDDDTDKFIVGKEQLLSLFSTCPACGEESQGRIIFQQGTYIKVQQSCGNCGHQQNWQNQRMLHRNMPAFNLTLSGAIHFTGCMATQTIRMLKLFGLQCISAPTFFRHQRLYTIPTIITAWEEEKKEIIRELKELDGGLVLSGDCRSDSPGHCAKYGSYTLIEDRVNKVLDVQLVQSSEVPSSSWCELEGLKRSIQSLKEQNMQVSTLITDRNRQVAKWVREQMAETSHFFDIWHIGKSVQKALDAGAKERGCEDLSLWRPAIINHLYWTAASTPSGDPDVMEAKWTSMIHHVQDIHHHETPAFPSCAHPPLEGEARDKEWLEPGSAAAVKLESIAAKKALLKDVRKLSPQHQTYSLEAYHSLILRFAPKHTGFSYLGMFSRLLLAALHFNCNSGRDVARTSTGEARYAVRYPRFKKGGWVVRPIVEKASYGYASQLMTSLEEGYTNSPQALQDRSALLGSTAPPPLTSSLQKIAKDEAVGLHIQRHSRFNTSGTS
ncbi:uncharacterized protein LOC134450268 isoform X2 [Engraulis encrasicolus]